MFYTDDPLADYSRYCAKQEEELKKMPICRECEEHIQDEKAYHIDDKWICESCMENFHEDVQPIY